MDQSSKRIVAVHVAAEMNKVPEDYGHHCLESIVNVRCATRISGRLMNKSCPGNATKVVSKESGIMNLLERFNYTLR